MTESVNQIHGGSWDQMNISVSRDLPLPKTGTCAKISAQLIIFPDDYTGPCVFKWANIIRKPLSHD